MVNVCVEQTPVLWRNTAARDSNRKTSEISARAIGGGKWHDSFGGLREQGTIGHPRHIVSLGQVEVCFFKCPKFVPAI